MAACVTGTNPNARANRQGAIAVALLLLNGWVGDALAWEGMVGAWHCRYTRSGVIAVLEIAMQSQQAIRVNGSHFRWHYGGTFHNDLSGITLKVTGLDRHSLRFVSHAVPGEAVGEYVICIRNGNAALGNDPLNRGKMADRVF